MYEDNVDYIFEQDFVYEADDFDITRNTNHSVENSFGRYLIEVCKNFSVHIVNGRVRSGLDGEITCVAIDGSEIVDYFIVSSALFKKYNLFLSR